MMPSGLNNADPIIIIDDSDDAPTESIPPPSQPRIESPIVYQEVEANENGGLVFEEDVTLVIPREPQERIEAKSGHGFRFHGTNWSTLVVFIIGEDKFGVFLGADDPESMPPQMQYKFKFRYDLLDSDSNWIASGPTLDNVFRRSAHKPGSRLDCGDWKSFSSAFRVQDFIEKYSIEQDGAYLLHFRLRLALQDFFMPSVTPANYNSKVSTGMVGLENLGATCYLNSLLQMLYHISAFRKLVYSIPIGGSDVQNSTTLALQSVFRNLQYSPNEVTTKDLTAAFGWTSVEALQQQDIQEMLRVLLDKLEEKMKGTPLDGRVQQLFAGKVRSYIQCVHVNFASNREEDFYDIQLDVKGCRTVYDSLKKYVEIEMLDGENQYDAERFGKQDARKGVIFTSFPPVLTMHLKRFDFDFHTMAFRKIHDQYEFPAVLDIDDYLAEDSPTESRAIRNRYLLHSVLVHAGDVGGGHYYAYIRPPTQTNYQQVFTAQHIDRTVEAGQGEWFKFNDEVVLKVDSREAIQHCYGRRLDSVDRGSMSSAYMLVYIREEDAPTVMLPITDQDIPRELSVRLDREKKRKIALERQAGRQEMQCTVMFATEQHLRQFHQYSRSADLINEQTLSSTWVFTDCTFLGLHLHLAKLLRVSPQLIRLWRLNHVNHLPSQKASFTRMTSCVSYSEYHKRINSDVEYFVEVYYKEEERILYGSHDDDGNGSDDDPADRDDRFHDIFAELMARFDQVKRQALDETDKYPELSFLPDDDDEDGDFATEAAGAAAAEAPGGANDPAVDEQQASEAEKKRQRREQQERVIISLWESCIVGGGNRIMYEFRDFDSATVAVLRQMEKEICKDAIKTLQELSYLEDLNLRDEELEEYPVVFKIFDPQQVLGSAPLVVSPQSFYHRISPPQKLLIGDDLFDSMATDIPPQIPIKSAFTGLTAEQLIPDYLSLHAGELDEGDFLVERFSPSHVMKTVAFARMQLTYPVGIIITAISRYLRCRYVLPPTVSAEEWKALLSSAELFVVNSCSDCQPIPRRSPVDGSNMTFKDLITPDSEGNLVVVLSLAKRPADVPTATTESLASQHHSAMDLENTPSDLPAVPTSALAPAPAPATATPKVFPSTSNPFDAASDQNPAEWLKFQCFKRMMSILPYSKQDLQVLYQLHHHRRQQEASDTLTRKRRRSKNGHQHQPSSLIAGFDAEIPINATVPQVLQYIAQRLAHVVPFHQLAVTVTAFDTPESPPELASHLVPADLHFTDTLSAFLTLDRRYERKALVRTKRWILLYRILPFPLISTLVTLPNPVPSPAAETAAATYATPAAPVAQQIDTRNMQRLFHFLVTDARLRFWRVIYALYREAQSISIDADVGDDATEDRKLRRLNDGHSSSTDRSTAAADEASSEAAVRKRHFLALLRSYRRYLMELGADESERSASMNIDDAASEPRNFWTDEYISLVEEVQAVVEATAASEWSSLWPAEGLASDAATFMAPSLQDLCVSVAKDEASIGHAIRTAMGITAPLMTQLPFYQSLLAIDMSATLEAADVGVILDDSSDSSEPAQVDALLPRSSANNDRYQDLPLASWLHPDVFPQPPIGPAAPPAAAEATKQHRLLTDDWTVVEIPSYDDAQPPPRMLGPILPVVVSMLSGNIIYSFLHIHDGNSILRWPRCWPEVKSPFYPSPMVVQSITPEEWLFMRNAHPSVRSMVISVFHFTLHGSMVQALDPSFYSGPFLTYLREDDDYETFLQRLMRVSGDVELISSMRTRLAVVHPQKLTPDFIPRPVLHGSASSVAAGMVTRGTDDSGVSAPATSSNGANGKSLYQRFADVYPEYAAGAETTYEMSMMNTSLQAAARRSQGHSSRNTPAQPQQQWHTLFPALGIQRSVTDMQQVYTAHLTNPFFAQRQERRGQVQQSTGIRIV